MTKILPDINESLRLNALDDYDVLDSLPEKDYDDLTRIASMICDTPIALISLIDNTRQFFKSRLGIDVTESPKGISFCTHAIQAPREIFIIPDARIDERFSDNPLVVGSPGVVFYAGMPLVTPEGFALGTICVIDTRPRDLTEQQKITLMSLANQVINLLELRKKNALLVKSQNQLQVLAKEMEAFACSASHDLKEPIRMVKSFTGLLEKKYAAGMDETARKYIYFASDGAKRMEILINDLLEYSRTSKINNDVAEVSIQEIVEDVKQLFSLDIAEKSAVIEMGELPRIRVSRAAIRQILQNIISNAVKYHEKDNNPVISIQVTDIKTHWQFAITDNGIGIPEDQQEVIFGIFKRLHSKENYSGTGIGLAICKKIVENYGGNIWVTSTIGKGSTFYFTIIKINK